MLKFEPFITSFILIIFIRTLTFPANRNKGNDPTNQNPKLKQAPINATGAVKARETTATFSRPTAWPTVAKEGFSCTCRFD